MPRTTRTKPKPATRTRTEPPYVPASGQIICYQQVCCPRCETPLARECIDDKIDRATGIRTVRGFCDHCNLLARGRYRLAGTHWEIVGTVEIITDPMGLKSMLARIYALRGGRIEEPKNGKKVDATPGDLADLSGATPNTLTPAA